MNDRDRVAQLLGRKPRGAFDVVVRDPLGDPVVVRNEPFLADGTPMPTRYYLVSAELVKAVSRLEAAGGVRQSETEIDADSIAAAHARYEAERTAAISTTHEGPRPYGGVGGTRQGVKCLHAHVANTLAGNDDPVGRWALAKLDADATTSAMTTGTDQEVSHHPGRLTIAIDDRIVTLSIAGGDCFELAIGPHVLLEGPLEGADPPSAMHLTNTLGMVQDHIDDIIIEDPAVAVPTSVVATGEHATAFAHVEVGVRSLAPGYVLTRSDADELFRTLVAEPIAQRSHNPGLDERYVASIVGTCCVILAVMRRLDLQEIAIEPESSAAS